MDRRGVFGKRVRALREARGHSQEDLANLARLHRTYVGGVERGERNVSLLNIWRIADALGVDPPALFPLSKERAMTTASDTAAVVPKRVQNRLTVDNGRRDEKHKRGSLGRSEPQQDRPKGGAHLARK